MINLKLQSKKNGQSVFINLTNFPMYQKNDKQRKFSIHFLLIKYEEENIVINVKKLIDSLKKSENC